ncbi:hypothetical protein [Paenarthrobacter nitroguajacolicus]|uniref:hypothetical protein n=1 Tax=Paenarthrobacter nitroguajacolicus TaxID=211146 RepID=UPI00248BC76B|nr:hypothetical protein [Paenarthrobacter nitroguajacolicus]MDI2032994.1 hypothetical protein [Paenarthrobacter nitroguajacolicus]
MPNIKFNDRELSRLLKETAKNDVKKRADRIAAAAGDGMESSVVIGRTRARASVITATYAARTAEARNAALTRAIDAGR